MDGERAARSSAPTSTCSRRSPPADCDVGLTNHYYLGRILEETRLPRRARLARPGRRRRAHQPLRRRARRGLRSTVPTAVALMEYLTAPPAQEEIVAEQRVRRQPGRPAARAHPRAGPTSSATRSTCERAGPLLADAVALMHRGRVEVARRPRAAPAAPPAAGLGGRSALLVALARRRPAARAAAVLPRRGRTPSTRSPHAAAARRCARACVLGGRGRRGHARCSAARWPRSCRSTTSPAAAGSTGRSCSRWRCRRTCSCSCCSASTTGQPAAERLARCWASELPSIRTTVGDDRRADARALPVRLHARPQRVPRPVAPDAGGRAHARAAATGGRCVGSRCRWPGPRSPPAPRWR